MHATSLFCPPTAEGWRILATTKEIMITITEHIENPLNDVCGFDHDDNERHGGKRAREASRVELHKALGQGG